MNTPLNPAWNIVFERGSELLRVGPHNGAPELGIAEEGYFYMRNRPRMTARPQPTGKHLFFIFILGLDYSGMRRGVLDRD
jgi:hypothetical protein